MAKVGKDKPVFQQTTKIKVNESGKVTETTKTKQTFNPNSIHEAAKDCGKPAHELKQGLLDIDGIPMPMQGGCPAEKPLQLGQDECENGYPNGIPMFETQGPEGGFPAEEKQIKTPIEE